MRYQPLSPAAASALPGLDDWRVLLRALHASFRAPTFAAAADLVAAIGAAADAADHHPEVRLSYPGVVHVSVTTHAIGGLSTADVELARTISSLAAAVAAAANPAAVQALELALDTVDADRIRPFWAAVLAYTERDEALHDPAGIGPALWFQAMDPPRRQRNRFHLDVTVPHDQADARVAAALAAGGVMVSDEHAPRWWVLADAEGNEACITTWLGREP